MRTRVFVYSLRVPGPGTLFIIYHNVRMDVRISRCGENPPGPVRGNIRR